MQTVTVHGSKRNSYIYTASRSHGQEEQKAISNFGSNKNCVLHVRFKTGPNYLPVCRSVTQLYLTLRPNECFPDGSDDKASACGAGGLGSIPGSGRSPGEGNGNPLQYSYLENPLDGGVWWAIAHRVAKSRTRLSDFTFIFFHYDPMDCRPGSSVHVILQRRILERVVISFSRESSLPRDQTHYLLQWQVNSLPPSHL